MDTNSSGPSADAASETSKKKILAGLVFSCLVLLALTLFGTPESRPELTHFRMIDEVVVSTLGEWNINPSALSYTQYAADSVFARQEVVVVIHPSLPATLMHARIARQLSPLGVDILGERYFPENTLKLDFIIYDTLVYSLIFETSTVDEDDQEQEKDTPDIVTD